MRTKRAIANEFIDTSGGSIRIKQVAAWCDNEGSIWCCYCAADKFGLLSLCYGKAVSRSDLTGATSPVAPLFFVGKPEVLPCGCCGMKVRVGEEM